MTYEQEVAYNAAKQVLSVAPQIEAYLKKSTGKSYKLKKPLTRDKLTVTVRFVGRMPPRGASPFDFVGKVWTNRKTGQPASEAEVNAWLNAPTMPDGFLLDVTYLPGPDLYSMRTRYITWNGAQFGEKVFSEVYVDLLEQPDLLFRDAVKARAELPKTESLAHLTSALRAVLDEEKEFMKPLDSTDRFRDRKEKARKHVPNPEQMATRVGSRKGKDYILDRPMKRPK